jgi:hypothetical protein
VWTLNENDHPTKCGLKGELTGSLKVGAKAGCTTGVLHALPPTPPAPPGRNPTLQLIYIRQRHHFSAQFTGDVSCLSER